MKKKFILMFVAVSFMAVAASGEILTNGDMEIWSGDPDSTVAPDNWDWELPTYGGGIPNSTVDVSAIGGGGGGAVGVQLGNWDDTGAWSDGIQTYYSAVAAGVYTVSITYAVTDPGIGNYLTAALYDVTDTSDPATVWEYGNYAYASDKPYEYVATTTDTWHTIELEMTSTIPSNTLFINSQGYDPGNIIIGAVSMVPEPVTLTLLGIGVLGLIRRKRR